MNLFPSFAIKLVERMKTRGKYAKGWPLGAVVHFTAGRDGAKNTILGGIKEGYAYWCIQRDGSLFCAHPANEWGWHCGQSAWTRFARKLVGTCNDDLIGIEINAAGAVTRNPDGTFKTWFKQILQPSEVRYTPGIDNQAKGWYHKYTDAQEHTLTETLMWLKEQAPDVFDFDLVLGHDEVSGPKGIGFWRKTDPGAALSMTMTEYRAHLKKVWAERQAQAAAPTLQKT